MLSQPLHGSAFPMEGALSFERRPPARGHGHIYSAYQVVNGATPLENFLPFRSKKRDGSVID